MIKYINWIPLEIDNILENREEIKKVVDEIDVEFEIAALVASTEAVDDVQLLMGYFMELKELYLRI